jgi:sporulation protein YlmC with PRC-barrel domain
MSMRVDLDAKVRTHDHEDAGSIEGAIIDPSTNQINEFVVNTGGLLGRQVVVPFAEIEAASRDGDTLRLRLTKAELERLPTYAPEQFVAPPAGWVPPTAWTIPNGGYLWPANFGAPMPYAPPPPAVTAYPPATDAGSLGGDARADEVSIPKGAVVLDREGEEVGVVDDVRLNAETGQLMGFVLRVGGTLRTLFGGGDMTEITRSQVDRVSEGVVRLRLTKTEVERIASRESR